MSRPSTDVALPWSRPTSVLWGATTIVVPYVVAFGLYVYGAVQILSGTASSGSPDAGAMAILWGTALVAIALAVVLAARGGVDRVDLGLVRRERSGWWDRLGLFAVAYLFLWVAFQAASFAPVLEQAGSGGGERPGALMVLLYALHAGVAEEILILAVPVAVLTRLRAPGWVQVAVIVVLRGLFHLYYGVPMTVTLVLVWSVLFWLLYSRHRDVWPFVAAHVLYDVVVANSAFGPAGKVVVLLAVATLALGVVRCIRSALTWRRSSR
ncbi:CPBP family intramembrane glutamic endopeptidase [Oerskovia paurometabola]|uniref:CPBP family intramembrane glutamic endopeptidase n=1 Tax=Oerskovia paurometabola TaxID=162170 RepID=UPI00341C4CD2